MRQLRIGILLSSISRAGGGISQAVLNLCEAFARQKTIQPVIFALRDEYTEADLGRWKGMSVHIAEVAGSKRLGYAPTLVSDLSRQALDLLHLHGIWMYPSAVAASWRRTTGKPLVISPHGMMDPWILSRGRLKKFVAKILYERRSWSSASAFHALNQEEASYISGCVSPSRIIVLPNPLPASAWQDVAQPKEVREKYFLYLGRFHPKKNVVALVKSWVAASREIDLKGRRLLLAGWGDPQYVDQLKSVVGEAARENCDVELLGPVFGKSKEELLARSEFLVLPSFGEGLPMAIAEAWAHGTPTIMSAHCNLSEGFERGCAILSGTTTSEITAALCRAATMPDAEWDKMSQVAVALSRAMFDPSALAKQWYERYSELLS